MTDDIPVVDDDPYIAEAALNVEGDIGRV